MGEATNQKVPGTQGPFAPKGQNPSISINAWINTTSTQKMTTETISDAAKSPKTQGASGSKGPKSPTNKNPKTSTHEEMVAFTAQAMNTAANFSLEKRPSTTRKRSRNLNKKFKLFNKRGNKQKQCTKRTLVQKR